MSRSPPHYLIDAFSFSEKGIPPRPHATFPPSHLVSTNRFSPIRCTYSLGYKSLRSILRIDNRLIIPFPQREPRYLASVFQRNAYRSRDKRKKKKKKRNDVVSACIPISMDRARRLDNAPSSLRLFRTGYSLFFYFFSLFLSSPFLPRDPLRSRHLTVHGILHRPFRRDVDGGVSNGVLKHEASACHRRPGPRGSSRGRRENSGEKERARGGDNGASRGG